LRKDFDAEVEVGTTLGGKPEPGAINENAAYDFCCDGEKVTAVFKMNLTLVDQFEVSLMDESRGLNSLVARLTGDLTVCDGAKFLIDASHEATESFPVAITP